MTSHYLELKTQINMITTAKELDEVLRIREISQVQLSQLSGVSTSTISKIRRGLVGGELKTWININDALNKF